MNDKMISIRQFLHGKIQLMVDLARYWIENDTEYFHRNPSIRELLPHLQPLLDHPENIKKGDLTVIKSLLKKPVGIHTPFWVDYLHMKGIAIAVLTRYLLDRSPQLEVTPYVELCEDILPPTLSYKKDAVCYTMPLRDLINVIKHIVNWQYQSGLIVKDDQQALVKRLDILLDTQSEQA